MAPKVYEAPRFYPSHRDMAGPFEKYIESIEDELAEFGLGIIIPPRGWKPTSAKYENMNFEVPKPIKQHVTGSKGIYQSVHVEQKGMSLQEFKAMANLKENLAPIQVDILGPEHDDLERHFWKNVTHFPPLYGADAEGSLFDPDQKGWNVRDLDTCLSKTLKEHGASLPGVTTPYLYVGMWRSMFAWHTEDVDLYSVNYLHFGEPKSWYCIPPSLRGRFERVVQGLAPEFHRNCPEFLRHKETLVTPFLIQQHNIPVVKAVQTPGQWVINFPSAYHSGFNHGFNCAESTNFATRRWVEYGAKAKACQCSGESVRIDMRLFGVEPPPVKVKPGMLLLAPPLPAPDLTGAALLPVLHGKMVKRKALPAGGASGISPQKEAQKQPNKASSPGSEAGSPAKKRKAAGGEGKKGGSKKRKAAGGQNAPSLGIVAVGQTDPPLAPGLDLLLAVPPAKKRKGSGGSGSKSKKGGQGTVAAIAVAPGILSAELAFLGGVENVGAVSKGAKQKAPKAQRKRKGKQAAPLESRAVPVSGSTHPKSEPPLSLQVVEQTLASDGSPAKQEVKKAGGQKRKGKSAVGAAVPTVEPCGVASGAPPEVGPLPSHPMVQETPKPKSEKKRKSSKGPKSTSAAVGGSGVVDSTLIASLVQPGGLYKGQTQALATAGQAKVKVSKILRIKFNPPAGMAALYPAGAGPAKKEGQALRGATVVPPGSFQEAGAMDSLPGGAQAGSGRGTTVQLKPCAQTVQHESAQPVAHAAVRGGGGTLGNESTTPRPDASHAGGGGVGSPAPAGSPPDSAGGSDRVHTRRRGPLLDEPLAVLFKDPPTGTKAQGRKRFRAGVPIQLEAPGVEGAVTDGRVGGSGAGVGQAQGGGAPTSGTEKRDRKRERRKKKGKKDKGRKEGPLADAPSAAAANGTGAMELTSSMDARGANEMEGGGGVIAEQAREVATAHVERAGSDHSSPPLPSHPPQLLSAAPEPTSLEIASMSVPLEQAALPLVSGGEAAYGEGPTKRFGEEGGDVPSGGPCALPLSQAGPDPAGREVPPSVNATGAAVQASSHPAAADRIPDSSLGTAGLVPGASSGVEAVLGGLELRAPGAGAPVTAQEPLPMLISSKQRKGKKKGGKQKQEVNASAGEGGDPKVPRLRPAKRVLSAERPATHQMLRRSNRNAPPAGDGVQEASDQGAAVAAMNVVHDAAGGTSEAAIAAVERGGAAESSPQGSGVEFVGVVRAAPAAEGGPAVEKPGPAVLGTGRLEAPAERLRGGAAPEASGGEPVSMNAPSQERGGVQEKGAKAGRLVMRVEGSRLLLRRVKRTDLDGGIDGQGIAGRQCKEAEQGGVEAPREEPEAAGLLPMGCPERRDSLKEVVGRQSHAIDSSHPAGGYEEKDTFNHKAECCELVLSEVTVLTSTADLDLEAPRQCQEACLMHLPVKPSHGDEVLETSSQDSLSLTYHGDSHEAEAVK